MSINYVGLAPSTVVQPYTFFRVTLEHGAVFGLQFKSAAREVFDSIQRQENVESGRVPLLAASEYSSTDYAAVFDVQTFGKATTVQAVADAVNGLRTNADVTRWAHISRAESGAAGANARLTLLNNADKDNNPNQLLPKAAGAAREVAKWTAATVALAVVGAIVVLCILDKQGKAS